MLNVEKIILFTKNHMSTRKKRLGQAQKRHDKTTEKNEITPVAFIGGLCKNHVVLC